MHQITNKEYDMVSNLIRDFLEEMEFIPFWRTSDCQKHCKRTKAP